MPAEHTPPTAEQLAKIEARVSAAESVGYVPFNIPDDLLNPGQVFAAHSLSDMRDLLAEVRRLRALVGTTEEVRDGAV